MPAPGPVEIPTHLVRGDPRHGVNRLARELAQATGAALGTGPPPGCDVATHVHFTDRLWGATPELAGRCFEDLARRHPVTVTLHDLPQASDGVVSHRRRTEAYRRVARASRAVVCNSRWERRLLEMVCDVEVTVIPLPVHRPVTPPQARAGGATADLAAETGAAARGGRAWAARIGLLGWIYPGKGHHQVIEAAAEIRARDGSRLTVVALGGPSAGHNADVEQLANLARERGVGWEVTGYLPDAELARRAAEVTVPVAAHQHVSASGSLNSWLSLHRRPLVLVSDYAREMAVLRPGTLTLADPDRLGVALRHALADPASTWLGPDAQLRPDAGDVAASYRCWWSEQARR